MTPRLAHIVRHPVKSAGFEELEQVTLAPGQAMPWDRHWAVAHAAARLSGGWDSKLNFLRGWGSADLMAVGARLDETTGTLRLTHPRRPGLSCIPGSPEGDAALIDWLRPLWPETRPEPAEVVRVPGQAMTDVPDPWIAVLNHSSNRALGQRMGRELSIHRWRGNLWLDGLAPWEEFDLVGRDFAIGPVRLRGVERIVRCRATCADPATGRWNGDTLAALDAAYGHQEFGIYAEVVAGGTVALGDRVQS
ncbi:MAG: MOSC domain-containing protein [Gemmobacter sp.]